MIIRQITERIKLMAEKFPVIAVTGPRQSGKTTLVRQIFPQHTYINLEDIEKRNFAKQDPKGFFAVYGSHLILDEVQYVPELFSYIQVFADEQRIAGNFVLTGSQNFLLMEKISQSLAGRVALFSLLPFSYAELQNTLYDAPNFETFLLNGFYPPIYDRSVAPADWYPNYLNTYIERDLHQILNVGDLFQFRQFVKMCANNIGQLINFSSIGNEIGVSSVTVKRWLSVLEASYIVYILPPYFRNFNKRIAKNPKLYFTDVGLASHLLGIKNTDQMYFHFMKGQLFENFIITELLKFKLNTQNGMDLFFWRDSNKIEADCLLEYGNSLTPIEIKSSRTVNSDFFKNLTKIEQIVPNITKSYLVYGGTEKQIRNSTHVVPWNGLQTITNDMSSTA